MSDDVLNPDLTTFFEQEFITLALINELARRGIHVEPHELKYIYFRDPQRVKICVEASFIPTDGDSAPYPNPKTFTPKAQKSDETASEPAPTDKKEDKKEGKKETTPKAKPPVDEDKTEPVVEETSADDSTNVTEADSVKPKGDDVSAGTDTTATDDTPVNNADTW